MTGNDKSRRKPPPITDEALLDYYIDEIMGAESSDRRIAFGEQYASLFAQMISARALDSIDRNIKKILHYMETENV